MRTHAPALPAHLNTKAWTVQKSMLLMPTPQKNLFASLDSRQDQHSLPGPLWQSVTDPASLAHLAPRRRGLMHGYGQRPRQRGEDVGKTLNSTVGPGKRERPVPARTGTRASDYF